MAKYKTDIFIDHVFGGNIETHRAIAVRNTDRLLVLDSDESAF